MSNTQQIILGGGCFWCIEAVFQRIRGVEKVVSGYAGGNDENPNYQSVSGGSTGHAEVVQLTFDPEIITLPEILDIYFHLHDPTTLDRQGADVGSQYRSIILYNSEEQKETAMKALEDAQPDWANPIVTQIEPLKVFYRAEDYHQDYFNQHPTQGYCQVVISPKLSKLYEKYSTKLVS